jgi:hypothetical protein
MHVRELGSQRLICGLVAVSSDAVPLSTNPVDINEVMLQSSTGNSDNVWVGNSTTRSIFINPGNSISIPVQNLRLNIRKRYRRKHFGKN